MTKERLRGALEEAIKKDQRGLLIWANRTVWEAFGYQMELGNEFYDFAISQITKGKVGTIDVEYYGLPMPGFIAVPVQKLNSSNKFFKRILDVCKKDRYVGPITLVPLNEVSESR